jgi:hypothetical protein
MRCKFAFNFKFGPGRVGPAPGVLPLAVTHWQCHRPGPPGPETLQTARARAPAQPQAGPPSPFPDRRESAPSDGDSDRRPRQLRLGVRRVRALRGGQGPESDSEAPGPDHLAADCPIRRALARGVTRPWGKEPGAPSHGQWRPGLMTPSQNASADSEGGPSHRDLKFGVALYTGRTLMLLSVIMMACLNRTTA